MDRIQLLLHRNVHYNAMEGLPGRTRSVTRNGRPLIAWLRKPDVLRSWQWRRCLFSTTTLKSFKGDSPLDCPWFRLKTRDTCSGIKTGMCSDTCHEGWDMFGLCSDVLAGMCSDMLVLP